MNKGKQVQADKPKLFERIKRIFQGKWKEIILVIVLALALLFAVWQIFYKNDKNEQKEAASLTQSEIKVANILEEIEGVGEKKRKALLERFKTIDKIIDASVDELATAEGIGKELAARIYEYLKEKL